MDAYEVLFEDDNFIAVNKPSGLLTHPIDAQAKAQASLVDFIKPLTTDDQLERPGIIHRLDKDTSGVILLAKNRQARIDAQAEFAARRVKKQYLAVVSPVVKDKKFKVDAPIERQPKDRTKRYVHANGKTATTEFEVLQNNAKFSLVLASPKTGRTHQIRVHLAFAGYPIVNDGLYNKKQTTTIGEGRLFLHSHYLSLSLYDQTIAVKCPAPQEFYEVVS